MFRKQRPLCTGATVVFCLLLLSGCGETSSNCRVSGQVTLDDQPLPTGRIKLIPGSGGHTAGGKIVDGYYNIGPEKGPAPGTYSVQITSFQPTGKKISHPESATGTIDELKETIPSRYNELTTLTITVSAGGDNEQNFPLLSKGR